MLLVSFGLIFKLNHYSIASISQAEGHLCGLPMTPDGHCGYQVE
jgi:hypothetical protein